HDMLARVQPAIREAADLAIAENTRVAIVAHAGTVRAALALAMETAAPALAFQVTHLGAARFRCFPGGLAVTVVNEVLL
ncbi:MAG: histidine phosphatase family protein, partial [Pseudomonadota bacterium]